MNCPLAGKNTAAGIDLPAAVLFDFAFGFAEASLR